jgi:ElaB/YqjD/DUF883 family membrane-anchored ribosome-binding protein
VNVLGVSSHSPRDKEERQSTECPPDNKLPENSQENLDTRLDHAIEETFPTSDPISVTITKGPEPDRPGQEARSSSADDQQALTEQDSTEHILDQVREALHDVTEQASGTARDVYNRGEHYVRQARERNPEAERHIRASQHAVTQQVTKNPLLSLFMAGVAGYALGWLIHGEKQDRKPDGSDYIRTRRGYAPHRDKQG